MNRRLVINSILKISCALLFALALGSYLSFNIGFKHDHADILPSDILALISIANLSETVSSLQNSPIGQEILDPSFGSFLNQVGISEKNSETISLAISNFEQIVEHPFFTALSKRQCSLAVLPPEKLFDSIDEYLLQNTLLLVNLKVPFNSSVILKGIFSEHASIEELEYFGEPFFRVSIPEQDEFYCTLQSGVVIASLHSAGVKRFLELSKEFLVRPGKVLGNDSIYKQKQFDNKKQDFYLYVNTEAFSRYNLSRFMPESIQKQSYHRGERFFLTLKKKGEIAELTASMANYLSRPHNLVSEFKLKSPKKNLQITNLPAVSTYFWTNWLDFDTIWLQLSKAPTLSTATIMFFIAQKVYEHTGVDLNVLSAMFANEFSFFVEDPSSPVPKKIPMFCFLFSLRQPDNLEDFFTKSISSLKTVENKINGYSGVSLLMAGGLIRPAYLFTEEHLFVADHISLIQRYFMKEQALKLAYNFEYKKVSKGFDQPSNLLIYSRLDQLNFLLQKVAIWGLHVLEKETEISSLQRTILTDRLIDPLFESLDHVKSQGVRGYQNENDLELRIRLYIPN